MVLPSTYYDFLMAVRPFIIELAELDAQDLRRKLGPQAAIQSVDDYESRFGQCVELVDNQIFGYVSRDTGFSVEHIRSSMHDVLPYARAEYASLYATINHEYHVAVNFHLAGKKTFHFSDNLSEHLANTEINLKCSLIQLPFATCLFSFTSRAVVDAMYKVDEKMKSGFDYSAPISVFLTILPEDERHAGRRLVICAWHAHCPDTVYLMLKRELYLADDWTLEKALHTDWEDISQENRWQGLHVDSQNNSIKSISDDTFYTDGLAFYRIILNAVLYLSSEQAELIPQDSTRRTLETRLNGVSSQSKRRKLLKRSRRHSCLDYYEVGSSIGTIVIEKAIPDEHGEVASAKSKPLVRFMVRGHWRNQPCGQGSQRRKLIWIRPYYKGADVAATINKPYVVK